MSRMDGMQQAQMDPSFARNFGGGYSLGGGGGQMGGFSQGGAPAWRPQPQPMNQAPQMLQQARPQMLGGPPGYQGLGQMGAPPPWARAGAAMGGGMQPQGMPMQRPQMGGMGGGLPPWMQRPQAPQGYQGLGQMVHGQGMPQRPQMQMPPQWGGGGPMGR